MIIEEIEKVGNEVNANNYNGAIINQNGNSLIKSKMEENKN